MAKGEFASWADSAADLVAVAAGRSPADLVVQNSRLVNVQSREVLEGWEIAVVRGRFAYVGPDARHCIGPKTQMIDAGGPLSYSGPVRRAYAYRKRHADPG